MRGGTIMKNVVPQPTSSPKRKKQEEKKKMKKKTRTEITLNSLGAMTGD